MLEKQNSQQYVSFAKKSGTAHEMKQERISLHYKFFETKQTPNNLRSQFQTGYQYNT